MDLKSFIEIRAFGDFDVMYTVCIMVHSDYFNKNELLNEFYQIQGISSNKGLDERILYNMTQDFVSFLELKGFQKLKTDEVYFCD